MRQGLNVPRRTDYLPNFASFLHCYNALPHFAGTAHVLNFPGTRLYRILRFPIQQRSINGDYYLPLTSAERLAIASTDSGKRYY